jgi:hypothetical protein
LTQLNYLLGLDVYVVMQRGMECLPKCLVVLTEGGETGWNASLANWNMCFYKSWTVDINGGQRGTVSALRTDVCTDARTNTRKFPRHRTALPTYVFSPVLLCSTSALS